MLGAIILLTAVESISVPPMHNYKYKLIGQNINKYKQNIHKLIKINK